MRRFILVATLLATPLHAGLLAERCSWTGLTSNPSVNDVLSTPVVADLDGDGDAEIVFLAIDANGGSQHAHLVAVDGDCRTLFEVGSPGCRRCVGDAACTDLDPDADDAVLSPDGVAVADLDGDGRPEIVASLVPHDGGASPRRIAAFRWDGSFAWCSEAVPPPPLFGTGPLVVSVPAIANVSGDARPEIVVGAAVFSADGTVLAASMDRRLHGTPSVPVDHDRDGDMEIAIGAALMDGTGALLWRRGDWGGFVPPASPVDMDGDGRPELVVSHDGTREVAILDPVGGATRASVTMPPDDPLCTGESGSAAVGDLDGDGNPEIVVATGTWACRVDRVAGPPEDLEVAWCRRIGDCFAGWVAPILADLTGDAIPEILVRDDRHLWVFDAAGLVLQQVPSSSATAWESVVAADVAGDCAGEIIVPADDANGFGHHGVRVFEGGDGPLAGQRRLWNQTAYHVTNVQDDGSIPAAPPSPRSYRLQVPPALEPIPVTVSQGELWPPNHRFVSVSLEAGGGLPVRCIAVRQDEPTEDLGDGAFAPDAILDGSSVLLRAERSGLGDGRTYHLEVVAGTWPCETTSIVTVCVPHDRGRSSCVDQGPLFDSTTP